MALAVAWTSQYNLRSLNIRLFPLAPSQSRCPHRQKTSGGRGEVLSGEGSEYYENTVVITWAGHDIAI